MSAIFNEKIAEKKLRLENGASQEIRKKETCIRKTETRKPLYCLRTLLTFACISPGVQLEITGQYFVSYS